MHYYQFNIGDYAKHTRHLTILEDIAYRRLLDWYYLNEKPVPNSPQEAARLISMRDHTSEVETVLNDFFALTKDGWVNKRADEEIAIYKGFAEAGKRGAAKRWSKGGDSPPIAPHMAPPIATNNQEPLTNNQIIHIPDSNESSPSAKQPVDRIPYEKILEAYHHILPMCPRVMNLTAKRKGQISARWKSGTIPDLETWEKYFTHVRNSKFLTGGCDPPEGRKRFIADLEWITNESNFTKIWEGKYHGAV